MPAQTLLQMTQNILTSMEDDEVNSISDTVSSYSVAQTVIDCYYELVDELSLPGMETLMQLEALSDVDKPNYLKMPPRLKKLGWLKYDGETVKYLTPREFMDWMIKRDTGVDVVDFSNVTIKVSNDADPTYWTSFDDTYIVFDSWNSAVDSTLQESKTVAFVESEHVFDLNDDEVPRLPTRLFPTLLSKAKARCFVNYKQVANAKEDQSERRGLVRHQNDMRRANQNKPIDRLPNYAHRGRTSSRTTSRR